MEAGKIVMICIIIINAVTFFIFGWDKMQAKRRGWRVAERTLFLLMLAGGSLGGMAGMKVWHHKTRKWYFRYGVPILMTLQGGGILYMVFLRGEA